nr:hypothetical protein GCM10020241_02380 [Streptoalloteichus tenebrarius]
MGEFGKGVDGGLISGVHRHLRFLTNRGERCRVTSGSGEVGGRAPSRWAHVCFSPETSDSWGGRTLFMHRLLSVEDLMDVPCG